MEVEKERIRLEKEAEELALKDSDGLYCYTILVLHIVSLVNAHARWVCWRSDDSLTREASDSMAECSTPILVLFECVSSLSRLLISA